MEQETRYHVRRIVNEFGCYAYEWVEAGVISESAVEVLNQALTILLADIETQYQLANESTTPRWTETELKDFHSKGE